MKTLSIKPSALLLVSAILIAGLSPSCVSTKDVKISSADRTAMRGKTFTVTTREKPVHWVVKQSAMAAASLTGAIGGGVAGAIAVKEGKAQTEKHHIENPNDRISLEVAKTLVAKTGARQVPSRATTTSLDPKKVAAENANADYVLDCFTTAWIGNYYPLSIGKYYIVFAAKMQLVETASGRVVAERFSSYQGKDKANAPDYDGIYSNGAAFLKSETKKGTDAAIRNFSGQF